MNDLLTTITLWCTCGEAETDGSQYELVEQDWHGERVVMKCPECGHTIKVDRSLVSPMANHSGV
jgi:uncharacterized Zn finger protein